MLTAVVGVIVVVTSGLVALLWLTLAADPADPTRAGTQLEVLRFGTTIALGGGGGIALFLAWRRQRSTEIALLQKERDQADVARAYAHQVQIAEQTRQHQERVVATTEADAAARRITDLYSKAADQLGSDKAPVRLAGLYALERLAQDNPSQRQTIVNLLCAYLRMPYTLAGDAPASDAYDTAHRERVQEREVRLTAQRILTQHLRPGDTPDDLAETFWSDIDIDLTGAALIHLNFSRCAIRYAQFSQATFTSGARFGEATFTGNAEFTGATFTGNAWFHQATFTDRARFGQATFSGNTIFTGANFTSTVTFGQTTFTGNTTFREATFTNDVSFDLAILPSTRHTGFLMSTPYTDFTAARFTKGVPPEVASFVSSDVNITDESKQ